MKCTHSKDNDSVKSGVESITVKEHKHIELETEKENKRLKRHVYERL